MDSKAIIRAVLAAFCFRLALVLSWVNAKSPLGPIMGTGDVYIELNRPGANLSMLRNAPETFLRRTYRGHKRVARKDVDSLGGCVGFRGVESRFGGRI